MHLDKHAPGTFCWFELATNDQPDAKDFYSNLFGWEFKDMPIGENDLYTLCMVNGRDAAAIYTMRAEQKQQGVPPNWLVYIAVESADAAAQQITAAGGTILAPPFDVMDLGRMTVANDPTGATFAAWEARKNPGTGIVHANGTVVWADLNTPDPARASAFYRDVFGWSVLAGEGKGPAGPNDYGHISAGGEFIGGIPPAAHFHTGTPPHWLIYFAVPDCEGAVAETIGDHGRILMPTMTMEGQRKFAVLADPQGAAFAVVQTLR